MEFLNPTALYGLLALPLLLVPYLIRRKPRRVLFSSLLLMSESAGRPNVQPWGRLRLPPLFFLQLLLLALFILALAEPVFTTLPSHVAMVIDNSASMQTREGEATRFALAQAKARALLSEVAADGQVDIYLTTPRLARARTGALGPSEAAAVINGLEPYDMGDAPIDYKTVLARLAQEHKYQRVYMVTDHSVRGQNSVIRGTLVGSAKNNFALTSFSVRRTALANASTSAHLEVGNFSPKEERLKIVVRGGGTVIGRRDITVGAGATASATLAGLPAHSYYEAEIENVDALALDNRRFAVGSAATSLRMLAVTPRPQEFTNLRAIPGVSLEVIAPDDYEKTERGGYGLEIFHFAAPATLPRTPALFILPPDANRLVDQSSAVSQPTISGWREPHVLTRYVNFALFRPAYARPLKPKTPADPVVEISQGPIALAIERASARQLILGFDPFPYLGRENLPMSIFTLNLIDWFFKEGGSQGRATGESLALGAGANQAIVTPKGNRTVTANEPAVFAETYYQGIYQVPRGAGKELVAVNLQDAGESDLRAAAVIDIAGDESNSARLPALSSYWPYLLLAALALLLLEWFVNPRLKLR